MRHVRPAWRDIAGMGARSIGIPVGLATVGVVVLRDVVGWPGPLSWAAATVVAIALWVGILCCFYIARVRQAREVARWLDNRPEMGTKLYH